MRKRDFGLRHQICTRIYASSPHTYAKLHTINKDKQPEGATVQAAKKRYSRTECWTKKKQNTMMTTTTMTMNRNAHSLTNEIHIHRKISSRRGKKEKDREREREKKSVTNKFMDCLCSISLTLKIGLCLNLRTHDTTFFIWSIGCFF